MSKKKVRSWVVGFTINDFFDFFLPSLSSSLVWMKEEKREALEREEKSPCLLGRL